MGDYKIKAIFQLWCVNEDLFGHFIYEEYDSYKDAWHEILNRANSKFHNNEYYIKKIFRVVKENKNE